MVTGQGGSPTPTPTPTPGSASGSGTPGLPTPSARTFPPAPSVTPPHAPSPARTPAPRAAHAPGDASAPGLPVPYEEFTPSAPVPPGDRVLWRVRTTVEDAPGSLAALCAVLAEREVDILGLQTHPLAQGTVDEFLLRAPAALSGAELTTAVAAAGGQDTWTERADTHDLVDAPTRVLGLAARTALDGAELPVALRQLLGRCTVRSEPGAETGQDGGIPEEGTLEDTLMRLRTPGGGVISVERPRPPFTPTEFARARALVGLDARLGRRGGPGREVPPPEDGGVTVRHADGRDLRAARAMHERCSPETLRGRYHGPAGDADRYLDHLLGPRHGRTLAARTASGRIVALGHLLWDGDETEIALLVEDDWQRRGIGGELLRRLVALAVESGCGAVYAVTRATNTGMIAAMRGLGLPLDYQLEEGTLVITARLDGVPAVRAEERADSAWTLP
ncbi:GNAT family N-acetyltransferase [Streptomyces sp. SHP 1-2]|uniref:GNAT family N-acetyltransferase n=1 Tax=Streptomyces sp. SHP 1-2 TaxID=2769489 RepID=UPI0039E1A979